MAGEGKEIKFKFVVDEQSAQRVNQVLDQMIKRAQELAKTLQGVGSGLGGGGGMGLMGGGAVGGRAPSPQSTMAKAAGTQTQTVSFASVLNQNVGMLKKMGDEGAQAMRVMSDALTRGVNNQKSAIGGLEGELSKLLKMYQGAGVQADGAFGGRIQQRIAETTAKLGEARKELAELQKAQGTAEGALAPEAAPGKQGLFSRFRGFLNSGGGIGGQDVSMANISKVPGLGFMSGMSAGGGIMMAAAGAAAALGVKAAMSQANAAWNNQSIAQSARADFGSNGPSAYARKLRGGDLSDVRAMADIMADSQKKKEYEEIQDPGWIRRQGNRIGAFKDAFSERGFKEGFSELFAGTEGYNYQKNLRGQQRETINKNIEERGVMEDIIRDATANSLGKMGTMRALGIGNGYKKTGAYVSNSERFLNQFSQFDNSEVIGAVQGIAGSGTRRAAYGGGLLNTVLQAQAAGINGAANIGGVFSRTGQGTNMIDLLRSMAGGGVDVSTTGLLGNYLSGAADNLNIGQFSGQGALGALSFGTSGPMGGMIARQNMQGMGRLQTLYAGTRDPAQAAINFASARRVAPDAGFYAQQYLATKLDANRVADALGPGHFELTDEERNLGLTPQMIRQQARSIQASQRFRTMEKGFAPGSAPAKMIAALKGGANLQQYSLETFSGEDKKWTDAERQQAVGVYATILRQGNPSMTLSEAEGQARQEMFGLGHRIKKGKMVGDVAGGSIEAKQAKEEAQVRETDRQLKDASIKSIEEQVAKEADAYKRLVTNSSNLAITADTITGIIKTFSENLKKASGGAVPPATNVKAAPK